jgi:hypothetical protein
MVSRFPKLAFSETSFGNRWAQEGKIPVLPFRPSRRLRPQALKMGRVGSAGHLTDCAWIT